MSTYIMPTYVISALEEVFSESVSRIRVVENSWYAALHGRILATTRKELILLNTDGDRFISYPELVLHEYYHVVRQWRTGELTSFRYILESLGNGYINNKYEVATNRFVQRNIGRFHLLLNQYNSDE